MKVSKSSFVPPPRVESGVVHLNFYDDSERIFLYKGYNKIVQEIFNYPRKTMRNIIRSRFGEEFLEPLSTRIDLNKRPMELTPSEIEFIYRVISENEK
jgi:16S rRNA A1518/A1519 N6-dimethyltransferase RsmA/KsgA/DIM1 with predicted DNA glycosylase/AP lyase activity